MATRVLVLLALLGVMRPSAASAQGQRQKLGRIPSMCVQCHTDVDSGKLKALDHGNGVSCLTCHHIGFTNDPKVAAQRRLQACATCHSDLPATHVGVTEGAPTCTDCHSIHGDTVIAEAGPEISKRCEKCHTMVHPLHADAGPDGPVCTDCHKAHTGHPFSPTDRSVVSGCSRCHSGAHPTHEATGERMECTRCHNENDQPGMAAADPRTPEVCETCHTNVHPTHVDANGDTLTCTACHDFGMDVPLSQAGPEMSKRCAACHPDAMAAFKASKHPDVDSNDPDSDVSNCLKCHTQHPDPASPPPPLKVAATERCMQCHKEGGIASLGQSYTDDFHGATMRFLAGQPASDKYPAVMGCTDCHGPHEAGMLDQKSVASVCLRCHQEGDARLAGAWLGHKPLSRGNQPFIWLIRMGYFILIPFMLTGLLLNIVFHLVDQRREGARVMKTPWVKQLVAWLKREKREKAPKPKTVERFPLLERVEHAGSALTFILLVVTGLPQTKPDLGIARALIDFLGGIHTTRIIHRTIGFTFVALMLTHVLRIVVRSVRRHRLPVMVPTRQDFLDVVQNFRHYLFGEPRPKVGKFDFAEKFEYWGLFLGGVVMSVTGLLLLFPALASHLLPGVVVAGARVIHGFEATFAVSVVVLWHSYGVILKPEVFPLDTSIFTGKMSVERLKHEHELEYEELLAKGEIEAIPDAPEPTVPKPAPAEDGDVEGGLAGA
jgi:predicted CXXCH cytochrome family protein